MTVYHSGIVLMDYSHCIDTYRSETAKLASTWKRFTAADWEYRPHPKSSTVGEILKHQLLSERRFFAEFLGLTEPPAVEVLPTANTPDAYIARMRELNEAREQALASWTPAQWHERAKFFDVERERIWIFWRRVLHTAHHRTQLTLYLRMLDRSVPSTYGPTADESWEGADPTTTIEAAGRG
jgi:uncharacterized damage-inducible protein DinB